MLGGRYNVVAVVANAGPRMGQASASTRCFSSPQLLPENLPTTEADLEKGRGPGFAELVY